MNLYNEDTETAICGSYKYIIIAQNAYALEDLWQNIKNKINVIPKNIVYVNQKLTYPPNTLLELAISENNIEIVKKLLEIGADPNIENYQGNSTLCSALDYSTTDMMELLLDPKSKGINGIPANPNITKNSTLIWAIRSNYISDIQESDIIYYNKCIELLPAGAPEG